LQDTIKQVFAAQLKKVANKLTKIYDIDKTKVDGVINDAKKCDDAVRSAASERIQGTDGKN
jgi:hypothetical protein